MNLEKLQQRIGLNGHIWEGDIYTNDPKLGAVEAARVHNDKFLWLAGEIAAKPPRLVKLQCLYPNIDRGTQRTHLYHRPGFNLDSLKVPVSKIASK
jgi:hypothetical protein